MTYNINDMQIMDSPLPIDLSISKPNYYSNTTCNSRTILLNQSPQKLHELSYISSKQPNYEEINTPTQKGNHGTNLIWNSLVSRVPSVSPDSSQRVCADSKQTNSQNEEMEQFRMEQITRRFSESSIMSEAKNDENRKRADIKATSNIPRKRKKSNDIPTIVSSDSGLSSNEIEEDEELSKGFSKLSRVDMSPISAPFSETGNCDSSTKGRSTRPFKAITSTMIIDPLTLNGPLGDFETFRKNILSKVNSSHQSINHNMRRLGNTNNTQINDPAYWEKRRRNNEAAKRSRDARKRKEDEVAIRCAYLEQERILILQENKYLKEILREYQQYCNH